MGYCLQNQTGNIFILNGNSLKLVDKFTYLWSSVSSIETDINTRLAKAWTANNRLSVIRKSDLTDKIKRSFFQAAVVSILLYGCNTWTLTKRMEKKLNGNYTRMMWVILNKSWYINKTLKFAVISLYQTIRHFIKFYNVSLFLDRLILKQNNIPLKLT